MENYRILAFGGAGNNIINTLLVNRFEQRNIFYFDTDSQSLQLSPSINQFQIGRFLTYGRSTQATVGLAKQAFDDDIDLFRRLVKPKLIYILIGGFGGGFFTGIINKVTELLEKENQSFIVIGTTPLSIEGKERMSQSIDALVQKLSFRIRIKNCSRH